MMERHLLLYFKTLRPPEYHIAEIDNAPFTREHYVCELTVLKKSLALEARHT